MLNYLDKLDIFKLDYVIATHPHEDHIGNMDALIRKYHIGKFLAPKATASTITFENMVTALNDKNLKISVISTGSNSINLGTGTSITFYTLPNININDELNLYSPIIKFTYKNISFLFTGDAELENEKLNILRFPEISDAWLDFIAECRSGKTHSYDIVEGPMANDTVWNYVNDFLAGRINRKQFWVLAEFKYPTHQISFHTLSALDCLTFVKSEVVYDREGKK